MNIQRTLASLLFFGLLGAAPAVFTAPAGDRPAGTSAASPFDGILPSGRVIAPVGISVPVGMNSLGVTVTPDGRYAIVSNDDEREREAANALDRRVVGGYSLAVVDTRTMHVADVYKPGPSETFFVGIQAVRDPVKPARTIVLVAEGASNAVRVFDLSATGKLRPEQADLTPAVIHRQTVSVSQWFPAGLVVSPDGRRAYVANNLSNNVTTIDVVHRKILNSAPVGYFPFGVGVQRGRLLVTNEGLMRYRNLPAPVALPAFAAAPRDPQRASSLSLVDLRSNGDVKSDGHGGSVTMDAAQNDGPHIGGAHPSTIVTSPDGRFAYVALTNIDRIATLSLAGSARVVGGLQLGLFNGSPYGTQPDALAVSRNGKTLYVALAGINAVAVVDARDPLHLHRVGLIPTGWYPAALTLSPDGRYLFVANAKGYGQDRNFQGGAPFATVAGRDVAFDLDSNTIWGTLQRVDLHSLPLQRATKSALAYVRTVSPHSGDDTLVPSFGSLRKSSVIKHVIFILEENKTYDSMLGDLKDDRGAPYGNGDPALVSFGENITPNLHALAREFGLATNEYADAEESDAGHQFAAAGIASDFTERTLLVKKGRRPLVNKNEDPEDYPRAGYIFNTLLAANMSYRDYGDLVRLSGYDEGGDHNAVVDDPNFQNVADDRAPTSGLGGLYTLNVPAPAVLSNHIDLNYPGWNLRIRDVRRAREFISDYGRLVSANEIPQLTYVWLPDDHGGAGPNIPPLPEEVADGDRALGMIVDYLSHLQSWDSTAIFITPDDAQSTRDHVNLHRSYAIVVSPYAKRQYTGARHISTVSILKTEEELLGLPALSLGDLLATDMSDFFTPSADNRAFTKVPVAPQVSSREGTAIAQLIARTDQGGPDADVERSAALIGLSRRADRLAALKDSMDRAAYGRSQAALYSAALRIVAR